MSPATSTAATRARRPLTGRVVLWGVIGFFAVIFAANGAFVYFALHSWPGLSTDNAYEEGLRYNDVLDAAAAQRALGWRSRLSLAPDGGVRIEMRDRDGRPLSGLSATVRFTRPVGDDAARELALAEIAPGTYAADAAPLARGRWQAEFRARDEAGHVYRLDRSLVARP